MKMITKLSVLTALTLALAVAPAVMAAGPPRVSPMATVSQTVGLAEVSITYSRPSVRGRVVFGELEKFGEVWRTGANEATTITLSHDAEVEGTAVKAGTYALFTIPGEDQWSVIFNEQAEQWGSGRSDRAKDVLKVEVTPREAAHEEMLTFDFRGVSADEATVDIRWAKTSVPFVIRFDTKAIAMETAKAEVAAAASPGASIVRQWASYFYDNDLDAAQALEWANSVASETATYWNVALQARLLAKNGQKAEAMLAAKKAVDLGKKSLAERDNPRLGADLERLTAELGGWSGR